MTIYEPNRQSMIHASLVSLICLMLVFGGGRVLAGEQVGRLVLAKTYYVEIPASLNVSQISDIGDFKLYRLATRQGKLLAQVYVGNHPQTERGKHAKAIESIIGGFNSVTYRWDCGRKEVCGETIITLNEPRWPEFVQITFGAIKEQDLPLIEEIIQSFSKATPR